MSELKLKWYQRPDGLWNAECPNCPATLCGAEPEGRALFEKWHEEKSCKKDGRPPGMTFNPQEQQ